MYAEKNIDQEFCSQLAAILQYHLTPATVLLFGWLLASLNKLHKFKGRWESYSSLGAQATVVYWQTQEGERKWEMLQSQSKPLGVAFSFLNS